MALQGSQIAYLLDSAPLLCLIPSSMDKAYSKIRITALILAACTFVLVALGAFVRATNAGLACPDWPLCFGRAIPAHFQSGIAQEVGHRFLASFVVLLTLILGYQVHKQKKIYPSLWKMFLCVVALLFIQVILGGLTVILRLNPFIVTAHLALGTLFLQSVLLIATKGREAGAKLAPSRARALLFLAVCVFIQILLGGFVGSSGAGLACESVLLCEPLRFLPTEPTGLQIVHMLHRTFGLGIFFFSLFLALVVQKESGYEKSRELWLIVSLIVFQIILGLSNVYFKIPVPVTILHLIIAQLILYRAVQYVRAYSDNPSNADFLANQSTETPVLPTILSDYLNLCKPKIIVLLLISTYCPMVLASGGELSASLAMIALVGGALVSASASALNCVIEKDSDAKMNRTKDRPIAAGRLTQREGTVFAIVIGLIGLAVLYFGANPLAAGLSLFGHVFYVYIYTILLKRNTPQNIVIGGAAGAVPPLVGWAAVTGSINTTAVLLFLVIFLWTPPHFWALALNKNEDYKRAGIPMLPVTSGERVTHLQMFYYALSLIPFSIWLVFSDPYLGSFSLVTLLLLGFIFAFKTWQLKVLGEKGAGVEEKEKKAWDVFGFSLVYLALFFVCLVVDSLVV